MNASFPLAKLASHTAPFLAMDILARAAAKERQGQSILHMEVGQPCAPAPKAALEAARTALDGPIGYTDALGMADLREALSIHYRRSYGVDVAPERIVITTGSSAGFTLAFLALFEPGARVAISAPGYPAYRNILQALGFEPVLIPLKEEEGWVMSARGLAQAHAQKPLQGVLLMSPANPSGTMIAQASLKELAGWCQRENIRLISDEIYHGLTYAEPAQTAFAFEEDAILINSFSKYFCMTGWRIGWMVAPAFMIRTLERLAQNLYISPPFLSQKAALAALDAQQELEAVRQSYARNRALLLEEFPRIGITHIHPADGAFYLYADMSRFTDDSLSFCRRMLEEIGVAAAPGVDFDPLNGKGYVRFSFAGSFETCLGAVQRLKSWLA